MKDEWIDKCAKRLEEITDDGFNCKEIASVCYTESFSDFPDDPEGAADEEVSCWNDNE